MTEMARCEASLNTANEQVGKFRNKKDKGNACDRAGEPNGEHLPMVTGAFFGVDDDSESFPLQ
jgi:hypothetical protein